MPLIPPSGPNDPISQIYFTTITLRETQFKMGTLHQIQLQIQFFRFQFFCIHHFNPKCIRNPIGPQLTVLRRNIEMHPFLNRTCRIYLYLIFAVIIQHFACHFHFYANTICRCLSSQSEIIIHTVLFKHRYKTYIVRTRILFEVFFTGTEHQSHSQPYDQCQYLCFHTFLFIKFRQSVTEFQFHVRQR